MERRRWQHKARYHAPASVAVVAVDLVMCSSRQDLTCKDTPRSCRPPCLLRRAGLRLCETPRPRPALPSRDSTHVLDCASWPSTFSHGSISSSTGPLPTIRVHKVARLPPNFAGAVCCIILVPRSAFSNRSQPILVERCSEPDSDSVNRGHILRRRRRQGKCMPGQCLSQCAGSMKQLAVARPRDCVLSWKCRDMLPVDLATISVRFVTGPCLCLWSRSSREMLADPGDGLFLLWSGCLLLCRPSLCHDGITLSKSRRGRRTSGSRTYIKVVRERFRNLPSCQHPEDGRTKHPHVDQQIQND